MRKQWILWIAIVMMAIGVLVGTQTGVYTASHMEWKRLYASGDASQIENLRITMDDTPRNDQIHWISTWKPGEEAVNEHRIQERPIIRSAEAEMGTMAYLDLPMDCYSSGTDLLQYSREDSDYEGMDYWYPFLRPLLEELADSTKPGNWGECDYRISEYIEDIFGQFYCDWNTNYHLTGDSQIWKALQEQSNKIRFRVPKDAIMSVKLYKHENGKVTDLEYNCHPEGSLESYCLSNEGILTPYGVYMRIDSDGDFMPEQGKGIYRIPYSYNAEVGFQCQAPEVVVRWEDDTCGSRLQSSADGEWMYLIFLKEGSTWLAVYDTKEGNLQQTILLSEQEEEYAEWIRMSEVTQVLIFDSGDLISLRCENGEWMIVGSYNLYDAIRSTGTAIEGMDAEYAVFDITALDAAVYEDQTAIGYHRAGGNAGGICVFRGEELIYQEVFETDVWREYGIWTKVNVEWEGQ